MLRHRLNRAHRPEDADNAVADDQSVARFVRNFLRGDWRKHFLSAYRESLAWFGARIGPRLGGRVDRPLTQRCFAATVFVGHIRALA